MNPENTQGPLERSDATVEEEEMVVFEETAVNVKCDSKPCCKYPGTSVNSDVLLELNPALGDVKLHPLPDLVPRWIRDQEHNTYRVAESSQMKMSLPDLLPGTDLVSLPDSSNPISQKTYPGSVSYPDIVICSVPNRSKSTLNLSECLEPRVNRQNLGFSSDIVFEQEAVELDESSLVRESWKDTGRSLKQIADGFTLGANSSQLSSNPAAQVRRFLRQVVPTGSLERVFLNPTLDQGSQDELDSGSDSSSTRSIFGDLSVSLLFKFALHLAIKKLHNVL